MAMFNPYYESVKVLTDASSYLTESEEVQMILEDANSPVSRKYQEKMYNFILNKAHVDFGDIPKSGGDIKKYSGYNTMVDTLKTIEAMANDAGAKNVIEYVKIVSDAIRNIEQLSATYQKGFATKTDYVGLEYDTYVYFCVEATTALIYSFVEVIKSPEKQMYDMTIKNNTLRADKFYFEQLAKFNRVQDSMGINYRKMLETMCDSGKQNFVGVAEAIGVGAIMAAAMAIIPVTREVIYQIYKFRGNLSNNLEMQAHFLELNKTCVNNNEILTADKKKKIMDRQAKMAKRLMKLADDIRVKSSKSIMDSKRELEKDNKMLSIKSIKDEISDSPLEII